MSNRPAVLTGRFAPFCNAHLGLIWQALKDSDEVVVVVTDADLARSSRLPWTAEARIEMAKAALADFGDKVRFEPIDVLSHSTFERAEALGNAFGSQPGSWGVVEIQNAQRSDEDTALAALYADDDETLQGLVPSAILSRVKTLRQDPLYAGLAEEHRYVQAYKAAWAVAPYPVIMVSVDAVIVHSGHLLLIERGGVPGKGLWALPGGFVEPDEWLIDAALRELREETGLQLNEIDAMQRLKGNHVFDDPWRSARGRVITHAYHFELDGNDRPDVLGQDDAAAARWVPLAEVASMRGRFFDDHNRIISHFLGI